MRIIQQPKGFGKPFSRFTGSDAVRRIQYHDNGHTPANKRRGEVESRLEFSIDLHREAGWATLDVTEFTTTAGGRVAARSIIWTLSEQDRKELIAFLQTGGVEPERKTIDELVAEDERSR